MTSPVVTLADQAWLPTLPPSKRSDRFGADVVSLSQAMGLRGLGCMAVVVAPGKRAFPFHNHLGNDEMFVILEGSGTFRFGDDAHPVQAGDLCAAPRGGPATAHQIINTGTVPLRYLAISTQNDPDIVEYPDSGKFGATAVAPGTGYFQAHLRFIGRRDDKRDYWEGEAL